MTLPCDRIARACFSASWVAVAALAVGVVVVAGGTEVALSPYDIGLAPGQDTRGAALEISASRCCVRISRVCRVSSVLAGTQC